MSAKATLGSQQLASVFRKRVLLKQWWLGGCTKQILTVQVFAKPGPQQRSLQREASMATLGLVLIAGALFLVLRRVDDCTVRRTTQKKPFILALRDLVCFHTGS